MSMWAALLAQVSQSRVPGASHRCQDLRLDGAYGVDTGGSRCSYVGGRE